MSVSKDGKHTVVPGDEPILHVCREDHPDNWHVQVWVLFGITCVFDSACVILKKNLITSF